MSENKQANNQKNNANNNRKVLLAKRNTNFKQQLCNPYTVEWFFLN